MITVYTSIIGNYDVLRDPHPSNRNVRFICYTDQQFHSKIWEIRKVTPEHDPTRQARKIKILTANEFAQSIWIDGNIEIVGNISDFVKHYNLQKRALALLTHPNRTNLKQEADAIVGLRKDTPDVVYTQLNKYFKEMYHCSTLCCTSIIWRQRNETIKKQAEIWFNEVLHHSKRDQMSFNYACDKAKIQPYYIPFTERNGSTFKYHFHPGRIKKKKKKVML